ncbi:hypothetical protein GWK47_033583 [Chionoecetes opilio]|uniref:Uncharacterized protein n=1 Tax=Chionoecetes opilio TaxID=41210 RepID=A0A8J4YH27_CHIOP|nr:hypothetical protein GWK47_033583 [Chionoecetes opilio]
MEEEIPVRTPTDTGNPLHDIQALVAGGAEIFHMPGPGEARTVQPQPQEGVRPGVRTGWPHSWRAGGEGSRLRVKHISVLLGALTFRTPGGHPVTEGDCCLLQVGLRLGQRWGPADYGDIVSIDEEVEVGGKVEVGEEDVE